METVRKIEVKAPDQNNNYQLREPHELFDELYQRFRPKVYAKCLSMLKEQAWARDATQEIFIQIFVKLPQFRQESRLSTWIFSIARNYCIDSLRRKKSGNVLLSVDPVTMQNVAEETFEWGLRERKLKDLDLVLQRLPPADNRILTMKFRDQMSIKAIAQTIHISEGAVKMRINRAKIKARYLQWQLAG